MGNIQSSVTQQVLTDYTTIVNNTVANVFNSASSACASGNTMHLQTGGAPDCQFNMTGGSLTSTQTAGTKCKLSSQNISTLTATFNTQITNNIRQFIENDLTNNQGWFATALSFQMTNASTVDDIMTQISSSVNANFINTCSSVANALNNEQVLLCGNFDGTKIDFTQNALVSSLTSCVNENTIKVWTQNVILNKLWQQTDQKLASTQSGISLTWIFAISAILIICCVLSIVGWFVFSGTKPTDIINSASQAVAQNPELLAGGSNFLNEFW